MLHAGTVTTAEEQQLLHFYGSKVPVLVQQLGLPRKVALTALVFLKRFFLCKSVLEADPARFMLTSIYLACKVGHRASHVVAIRSRGSGTRNTLGVTQSSAAVAILLYLLNRRRSRTSRQTNSAGRCSRSRRWCCKTRSRCYRACALIWWCVRPRLICPTRLAPSAC